MSESNHLPASVEATPQEQSRVNRCESTLKAAGSATLRYGVALVILWIGGMKFTEYEAEGIAGFVANSPLMSWGYLLAGTRAFSAQLGVAELVIALFIASHRLSAKASFVGGLLAVGMFLTTLSFLVTTPGVWEEAAGGFPALSVVPGQFLIKDIVLLGASLFLLGESWIKLRQVKTGDFTS